MLFLINCDWFTNESHRDAELTLGSMNKWEILLKSIVLLGNRNLPSASLTIFLGLQLFIDIYSLASEYL